MSKIVDFKCTYDNSVGINEEVTKKLQLSFPDAYKHHNTMVLIAKELKRYDNASFCELPFCHTVEGEAMGGIINYGDEKIGPRAKEYICKDTKDLLNLNSIDFTKGRIAQVLKACSDLREEGVNILGPKMMEQTVQMFTYPFLKKAEKIINDKTVLLLCPKTTFALLGTNKAKFYDIELSKPMKYGEGCIEVIGKTKILGQMCIKNINYKLTESKIKGIKLL